MIIEATSSPHILYPDICAGSEQAKSDQDVSKDTVTVTRLAKLRKERRAKMEITSSLSMSSDTILAKRLLVEDEQNSYAVEKVVERKDRRTERRYTVGRYRYGSQDDKVDHPSTHIPPYFREVYSLEVQKIYKAHRSRRREKKAKLQKHVKQKQEMKLQESLPLHPFLVREDYLDSKNYQRKETGSCKRRRARVTVVPKTSSLFTINHQSDNSSMMTVVPTRFDHNFTAHLSSTVCQPAGQCPTSTYIYIVDENTIQTKH